MSVENRPDEGDNLVQTLGQPIQSPNGRFLWDGYRWVPVAQGTVARGIKNTPMDEHTPRVPRPDALRRRGGDT